MRRGLLRKLPALTRFYYGAISAANVEQFTYAELNEYVTQMDEAEAEQRRAQQRSRG